MSYKMIGRDLFPGYALRGEARGVRERFADNPRLGNSPPTLVLFEREGRLLCRVTCPDTNAGAALYVVNSLAAALPTDAVCVVLECRMQLVREEDVTPDMLRPGRMQELVESGQRGSITDLMLAVRVTDDQPPKTRTAAYPYVREEGTPSTIRWLTDHPVSDLPPDQLVASGIHQDLAASLQRAAEVRGLMRATGETVTGRPLTTEELMFSASLNMAAWLRHNRFEVDILAAPPPNFEPDYADMMSMSVVAGLATACTPGAPTGRALEDRITAFMAAHQSEVESRAAAYGVPPERMRLADHMKRLVERVEAVRKVFLTKKPG